MSVTHIVHFSYVQTASAEEITRFNQLFLEFGENPLDSRILSIIGGSNNSIEQLDHGFQ